MRTRVRWVGTALLAGAVAGAAAGAGAVAGAQTAVYGAFTAGRINVPNSPWVYGPTVGLYHDNGLGLLALGYDVRGSFLSSGNQNGDNTGETLTTLQGGLRAAVTPHVLPLKPYVEALAGYGRLAAGEGSARSTSSHVTYQFLGGLDFTFFPRLDWRVVEFSYGHLGDSSYQPKTLSTGLVFRLP